MFCSGGNVPGGPVSRVLSCARYPPKGTGHAGAAIHLGEGSLPALKQPTRASRDETPLPLPLKDAGARPLFGLAPGGVCHASPVASTPVRSCRTLSPLPVRFPPIGGILSVALSLGFAPEGTRRAGVTRHPCFVE